MLSTHARRPAVATFPRQGTETPLRLLATRPSEALNQTCAFQMLGSTDDICGLVHAAGKDTTIHEPTSMNKPTHLLVNLLLTMDLSSGGWTFGILTRKYCALLCLPQWHLQNLRTAKQTSVKNTHEPQNEVNTYSYSTYVSLSLCFVVLAPDFHFDGDVQSWPGRVGQTHAGCRHQAHVQSGNTDEAT